MGRPASAAREHRALLARLDDLVADPHPVTEVRGSTPRQRRAAVLFLTAVLATIAGGLVLGVLVAGALALGLRWRGRRRALEVRRRVEADLVDVADLFVLAVSSGLNLRLALHAVAERAPPSWAPSLRAATGAIDAGASVASTLEGLPPPVRDRARPLVRILVSADRHGAPLLPLLEQAATDARVERRRQAEERARRVPVKLLFPLVVCVLPAFGLLTVVPMLAGAIGSLST